MWKISVPQRNASPKVAAPHGHDHELLKVDRVVRMLAAVDDVHHRHGQHAGGHAADVAVERQPARVRRRLCDREAHAEDGVRAEPRLVGRSVKREERVVDLALLLRLLAHQRVPRSRR